MSRFHHALQANLILTSALAFFIQYLLPVAIKTSYYCNLVILQLNESKALSNVNLSALRLLALSNCLQVVLEGGK